MPATAALDIHDPAALVDELAAAGRLLARERDTPASVLALVADLADAIASDEDGELAAINPWVWIAVQRAALRAQSALSAEEPQRRSRLRLALEQLRFLLARLAEREPVGEERPAFEVARWLEQALASVSQQRKAQLLGVALRTYQRWIAGTSATPNARDDRRLRIVARLVNQLRHSLTGAGVVDWFVSPRADLGGDAPADLLDDPERLEQLVAAAAASRGNVAA